ncbi:helix-turn-helix domain-containing protein [Streptomyces sp. NPDC127068]|uniref:helix-turn-helix domain-containing protein n=1 Tax=Streptomyces sp. NPDC127068 TaxID=3347127 RepID=UPI00366937EC
MTYAGKTVKGTRKLRGLTQKELAEHSGVSISTIRKLEQGDRVGVRMETLHALARTLRVPTMSLVAERAEDGPVSGARELWAPVRAELLRPPALEPDDASTPEGLAAVFEGAAVFYRDHRFAELANLLPGLLRDADALDDNGRGLRVKILQLTAGALTHTRQFDIAELALRRSLSDARDRLEGSASINTLCWLMMRQGRLDEALNLATQWADDLEPRISRATESELGAWGLMLLRASGAAIRNNQPCVAADMKKLARSAAAAIGHEIEVGHETVRSFGPTTVRLLTVEDALVNNKPDLALALAAQVPRYSVRPSASVRSRHGLDVANAHARLGHFAEAFDKLSKVQSRSPEWFPNQTPARDALRAVVNGRRSLTPQMRQMADVLNLQL